MASFSEMSLKNNRKAWLPKQNRLDLREYIKLDQERKDQEFTPKRKLPSRRPPKTTRRGTLAKEDELN